ncbi:MAG: hypothetical protein J7513_14775 [Solirubrobacteraceae bacterium]|nr:hypothetical protein [Solirubrobacteraceae bacterium]
MTHHTHTQPASRILRRTALALTAAGALAATAAPAGAASIWTPITSGTTETITSLSYRPGQLVYGTTNGKIYTQAGGLRASYPGQGVIDLAANPAGNLLIAVLDSGKAVRSSDGGATWTPTVQLQTYNFAGCASSPGAAVPLVNLPAAPTAVKWISDSNAYIVSNVPGSVLRTANGGASWSEISRQSNQTCTLKTAEPLTDVAPIVGSTSIYFIDKAFGNTYLTTDQLASTPSDRGESVNCFDQKPSLAVDSADGTRLVAGDGCAGGLSLQYSEDGGTTYNRPDLAPEGSSVSGINDVAFTGGTMIWAGKGGDVYTSRDGRTAYQQEVEGPDATRDWRAVSSYDAQHAAIAGTGGTIYVTTAADAIPDLVKPSGTIDDPGTVTAGVAKAFTASLLDNAGGSGIDPASVRWTATGIPEASGNPAAITFPSSGYYALTVRFKDLAGNGGEATRYVSVSTPSGATGTGLSTIVPGTTPGGKSVGSITGASFTLTGPKQCVPAGSEFVANLSMRRLAIKHNRIVKLRRVDFYVDGQRVKIDRTAPFRQTLRVKSGATRGAVHTLKAVGFVKVTRGKSPKRTQTMKFGVCL